MTTINRRVRLALNAVLLEYNIDDLQLEIDLTSAVKEELADVLPKEGQNSKGALAALEAHEENVRTAHAIDTSEFPEDVTKVIQTVCERWLITPPKRKKGGEYARWIDCARDLLDACAEFEPSMVLHLVHNDYAMQTAENNGKVPYTVSGPCALVKVCRAKAGHLRTQGHVISDDDTNNRTEESSFHF